MPRYNPRPRKGRSRREKVAVQNRTPTGLFTGHLSIKKGSERDSGEVSCLEVPPPVKRLHSRDRIENLLKENRKHLAAFKNRYKSAIQRERRAKEKILTMRSMADLACEQLSQSSRDKDNAESALSQLREHAGNDAQEIRYLQQRIQDLQATVEENARDLVKTAISLNQRAERIQKLENRQASMRRTHDALRKRLERKNSRVSGSQKTPVQVTQPYRLKDKASVIKPETRDMLRKLACEGVSTERVSSVIEIVAEGMGVEVIGSISARSVARIMLEGLIQARMQLGHELSVAQSLSICGDGTSIKNQQHEARLMYLQLPAKSDSNTASDAPLPATQPVLRTLGVRKAVSHMSQQQLSGWLEALDSCCSLLARSPLGKDIHINSKLVAPKLRGVLTDHAADQRRFHELLVQWKQRCDRERRAVSKLEAMSVEEQLNVLSDYLDSTVNNVKDWRTLPSDEQGALMHDAWFALAVNLGEFEFQQLSPEIQFETDFLAWAGCCMHKELNAVKGGVAKMALEWKSFSSTRPIALKNKFLAENPAAVEDKSSRGGVKLTSLAGALFRNKDDKKGYQKTVDNFFEKAFGYSNRVPDTSNTRYGSHCNAAAELILHRDTYLQLLKTLHDAKCVPGYTNIELNVSEGLKDTPTLTELAVLALYAQAVGHPYMKYVRSTKSNALELGPVHSRVKQHCKAIANDPNLLIGLEACAATGTLDGKQWDRPEVVYRILSMAPDLPSLGPMLRVFFEGALETWERFTHEFDDENVVAQATSEQRQSAWMPPTNDVSEGALGRCRQMLRRAPTMTDNQRNARVMWQDNHTYEWGREALTEQDERFVRLEARKLDASGENKLARLALNKALEERAASNRARLSKAATRKLAKEKQISKIELQVGATYETLKDLSVADLNNQIDKLRSVLGNGCMRPKSSLRNKNAKIEAILAGLELAKQRIDAEDLDKLEQGRADTVDMDIDPFVGLGIDPVEEAEMCFDDEVILD